MSDLPRFLALEGLRGVGKSTVAPLVAAALGAELVPTVPPPYAAARRHVDGRENPEARMCLYLAALFDAAERIRQLGCEGRSVVVESYFARCFATHLGMGARLHVVLPPRLPAPLSFRLLCSEPERQRRLLTRVKATTHWDALAESSASRISAVYDHFPMAPIDTTDHTPQQVAETICDRLREDTADADREPVGTDADVLSAVPPRPRRAGHRGGEDCSGRGLGR
ncbi:hypothetical protein [Streptomyces sp. SCSIO ZS0520]|uniref:hypothetical protein n=1 Tax=Streptomyces sp. SCSIO ZS0520 TaxID=2892996 RepID=UPI0021DAD38B|nr:hypothetical protein [Streptomyces sp. SCSIO ZS0520]